MSIWILHLPLTPQEEELIQERRELPLPFEGLPDLSMIISATECRHLLQALHPDEPPEAITRRVESLWQRYSNIHPEDIIAVPLPARAEMALAEVAGKYIYRVGVSGADVHAIPVTWHTGRVSRRALRKHQELFAPRGQALREVTNQEARTLIRDRLPYSYNRFVKWKWLLAVFFLLGLVRMAAGILRHS